MAIENGIYRIVPKTGTGQCAEVAGGSTASHANVQIYAQNEGNGQRVWLGTDSNGSTDFRFLQSGMMLDVWGGEAKTGSNITQYEYNATRAQDWQLADTGEDVTLNGVKLDAYYIKSKINASYVLDAWSGQTKNGTNVWLYESNKTDAQKWLLVKDSYHDGKLAVPANVGCVRSEDADRAVQFGVNAAPVTVYPAWRYLAAEGWQLRWSWRGRKTGTESWGAWSAWRTLKGELADDGWGDAWNPNLRSYHVSAKTGYMSALLDGIAMSVDQTTYDKKEYRIEVRQFGTTGALSWNADGVPQHGPSATGTVRAVWWPTLTVDAVTWTPDGLMIGYSSDFKHGGNRLAVGRIKGSGGYLTNREVSFPDRARTGTVTIPFAELTRIPDAGEQVSFPITLTTVDCTRTQSFAKTVAYDSNHGVALSVAQGEGDGHTVIVKLAGSYPSSECHIVFEQDGETAIAQCEPASGGGFVAAPPFGKPYKVFVKAVKSDSMWGTRNVAGIEVGGDGHVFNYGGRWAKIVLFDDYDSSSSRSIERDYEAYQTNGRAYESVFFGRGSKVGHSIEGIAKTDFDPEFLGAALDDLRALASSRYATYRTPNGDRYDVAITSISEQPFGSGFVKVSLEMRERS